MVEILPTDRRRPWETLLLGFPPNLLARELHLGRVTAELASPSLKPERPGSCSSTLLPVLGQQGREVTMASYSLVRLTCVHSLGTLQLRH